MYVLFVWVKIGPAHTWTVIMQTQFLFVSNVLFGYLTNKIWKNQILFWNIDCASAFFSATSTIST